MSDSLDDKLNAALERRGAKYEPWAAGFKSRKARGSADSKARRVYHKATEDLELEEENDDEPTNLP